MREMQIDADVQPLRVRRGRLRRMVVQEPEPWDDGTGSGPGDICLPTDWTAKRGATLMTQARNASTEQEWRAALEACDRFDHDLWMHALRLGGREGAWSLHRNNIEGKVYDGPYTRGYNPDAPMFEKYRRVYVDAREFSQEEIYAFVAANPTWYWYPHPAGSFMCNAASGSLDEATQQEESNHAF